MRRSKFFGRCGMHQVVDSSASNSEIFALRDCMQGVIACQFDKDQIAGEIVDHLSSIIG